MAIPEYTGKIFNIDEYLDELFNEKFVSLEKEKADARADYTELLSHLIDSLMSDIQMNKGISEIKFCRFTTTGDLNIYKDKAFKNFERILIRKGYPFEVYETDCEIIKITLL